MKAEEVHSLAVMALLNGEPLPEEAKGLLDDAAFNAEVEALAAMEEALFETGDALTAQFPAVDLVPAVRDALHIDAEQAGPPLSDDALISTYLDGSLDELTKTRLERRLAEDPELRREWESIQQTDEALQELALSLQAQTEDVDLVEAVVDAVRQHREASTPVALDEATAPLESALFELGSSWNKHIPTIDLRDDILAAVKQAKVNEAENITPFGVKQSRESHTVEGAAAPQTPRWRVWTGYAAAAAVIFCMGLVTQRYVTQQDNGVVQQARNTDSMLLSNYLRNKQSEQKTPVWSPELTIRPGQLNGEGEMVEGADGEVPLGDDITLDAILEARRKALVDDASALASLAEWASLTPEEALAVLEQSGYSAEMVLGVLPYLDEAQGLAVLKDAVQKFPRDPQLRYSLAKELLNSQDFLGARQQLHEWSKLDPENGLPVYMDAQTLLAQGDVEGARATLYHATEYTNVNTFSVASAQHHRDALIASGIDPDAATLLAGMSAFNGDYSELSAMGKELVAEGDAMLAQGDYAGAASMYKAASDLGREVAENASFPNEAQEGAYLQAESALLLESVMPFLGADEAAMYAGQDLQAILDSLALLDDLYRAVEDLYEGDIDSLLGFINNTFSNPQPIFSLFN